MKTVIERIFERSIPEPNTGCWLWCLGADNNGYGVVRHNGKQDRAHRVSYAETFGEIPNCMHVCHKCDVTSCVNPDHLFVGSRKDNMRDMAAKGRAGGQKLSKKQVIEIISSSDTQHTLARRYGVSQSLISIYKRRAKNDRIF